MRCGHVNQVSSRPGIDSWDQRKRGLPRHTSAYLPVPVRLMVCFPPLVLSLTVSVAERDPVLLGVKVTLIRQVFRGLIVPELGQVLAEVILKLAGFAPVSVIPVILRAAKELVSVRVELLLELVLPTVIEPKLSEEGKSVAVGTAAVPVPLRLMV
jgi:hypothetical protein